MHCSIALEAGIRREVADAIAEWRRPAAMDADEEITFEYVSEMLEFRQVSDVTFDRVESHVGTKSVVAMTCTVVYCTFLAMQLSAAHYQIPKDGAKLPRPPR